MLLVLVLPCFGFCETLVLQEDAANTRCTGWKRSFCTVLAGKTWLPVYAELSDSLARHEAKARALLDSITVHENFLSEAEEIGLLNEVEPYMRNLHYEFAHWDDAIHGYRETERLHWAPDNEVVLGRVRAIAFAPHVAALQHVHVLDLNEKGYIKPHIDAVRFCGDTIAGLSLMSDCVMRLARDDLHVKILLKRRSLYVMTGPARYDYTHEVLDNGTSTFKGVHVQRARRISVICRNGPVEQ